MTRRMLIKGGSNWEANSLNPKKLGRQRGHHIGYSVFVTEGAVALRKRYFALEDHPAETALRLACELRENLKGQKRRPHDAANAMANTDVAVGVNRANMRKNPIGDYEIDDSDFQTAHKRFPVRLILISKLGHDLADIRLDQALRLLVGKISKHQLFSSAFCVASVCPVVETRAYRTLSFSQDTHQSYAPRYYIGNLVHNL